MWRIFFATLYLFSYTIPSARWREWFRREKLFDYHAKQKALRVAFPEHDWRHFRLAKGGGSLAFITPDGYVYKIRKFHFKDDSITKFNREKRITDAIAPILSVQIPHIKIHQIGVYTVYETKFIPGKILLDLPLGQIRAHRTQIGTDLGKIIYQLFNANLPELSDMRPNITENTDLGMIHGDMCSNILIDPKTMKITGIIDWEYAKFGSLKQEFFGLFRVRRKMRLTDIAPEAIWEYYKLRDSKLDKTK